MHCCRKGCPNKRRQSSTTKPPLSSAQIWNQMPIAEKIYPLLLVPYPLLQLQTLRLNWISSNCGQDLMQHNGEDKLRSWLYIWRENWQKAAWTGKLLYSKSGEFLWFFLSDLLPLWLGKKKKKKKEKRKENKIK